MLSITLLMEESPPSDFRISAPSNPALPTQVITGNYLEVQYQDLDRDACTLLRQQSLW